MRIITTRIAVLVALLVVTCFTQTIKLASLAPSGSPYDDGLRAIAADWERISEGKIRMIIYSGGVAGDEDNMLRKMKIGQLQASGITGMGLCQLVKDILTIQLPMLVRTNEELFYVMEKMNPEFEDELEQKGIKVLMWMPVGWVHFFARKPIASPEQLKKMKMFFWAGDPNSVQAWKEMGYHPIPLAATDIMSSLQSGMVDAFAAPPLSVASYQWFTIANNMCDLKWGPLIGAIVISTSTWKKIPAKLKPQLQEAMRVHGKKMNQEILRADEEAIAAMKKNGLTVNPVSPAIQKEWQGLADRGVSLIENKSFKAEYRTLVEKHVKDFRDSR